MMGTTKRRIRILILALLIAALLDVGFSPVERIIAEWYRFKTSSDLKWIKLAGGEFRMGNSLTLDQLKERITGPFSVFNEFQNEKPGHTVRIDSFEILKTEVTVNQYRLCVKAGVCRETERHPRCNLASDEKGDHPVNCINWYDARAFCEWVGGRLPSEAEWEYAAKSGGRDVIYPWGSQAPTCDRAVIDDGSPQCEPLHHTQPVCSKPSGNTDQGLCDMAGNIWEWVEDRYHENLQNAPADGSAWVEPDPRYPLRVLKGGGIQSTNDFRASQRVFHPEKWSYRGSGIRCVR